MYEKYLLPQCLKIGMDIDKTYSYTLKEIEFIIKSKQEHQREQLLLQARMDFTQSLVNTKFTAMLLSKDAEAPDFYETYDFLLSEDDKKQIEEEKQKEFIRQQQILMREKMLLFANSINNKQKKEDE